MRMKNMKIAIIGANGYIGKHLEFYLKRMGLEPMCYDIQDDSRENYKQVDLTDKESVKNIDTNVDYICLQVLLVLMLDLISMKLMLASMRLDCLIFLMLYEIWRKNLR